MLRRRSTLGDRLYSTQAMTIFGGQNASPACKETFDAWHSSVNAVLYEGGSAEALHAAFAPHMAPDCVFRPPTYFTPWKGRDETLLILACVSEVFGPSFQYGRQWLSDDGREWALEFTADIAETGRTVHGIDMVSLCEAGRITDFTVLARPPNAVAALKDEMMRRVPVRLAKLKAKQMLGFA